MAFPLRNISAIGWTFLLTCAAAAGSALKIYQWYFSRPLWLDEQMVLLNVRDRAVSDLTGPLWLNQAAPFGWLVLQRWVVTAIGTGDRDVRAVPVLAGIATLWVAWWTARRWMTPFAGGLFITLCGIGQWMVFYPLEVKPYSADALCALALLACGVWSAEPAAGRPISALRTLVWWTVASLAQWLSFAATLATPPCAAVLVATTWRRAGWRSSLVVITQGLIWLLSFGAHYSLSMRYGSNDKFLRSYWASGFPPAEGGVAGVAHWLLSQWDLLAAHPGGTTLWIPFWLSVAYGISVLLIKRPVMGLMIVSMPLAGFVAAIARVAPFADRLALWTTPALYAAIAVAAGNLFDRVDRPRSPKTWAAFVAAVVAAVSAWVVCIDIVEKGRERVIISGTNHGLDDGRGVRLLMAQHQPGDVLLTPHFGLPAVWWYGGIDIAEPNLGGTLPDRGLRLFEIGHRWPGSGRCQTRTRLRELSKALAGVPRAGVYLGFDSNNPGGFQQLVLSDLARLGTRVFYSQVAAEGIVAIYDLRQPPAAEAAPVPQIEGCVVLAPAHRW